MAISLGRNCSLAFGGVAVLGVRDVTIDTQASTIELEQFGSRVNYVYQTGYSFTLTVETIDDTVADEAHTAQYSGAISAVTATGLPGGLYFVVTGVSDAQPLDGVRAFSIELKQTLYGLRQETF
jgi:hypothetical protein